MQCAACAKADMTHNLKSLACVQIMHKPYQKLDFNHLMFLCCPGRENIVRIIMIIDALFLFLSVN